MVSVKAPFIATAVISVITLIMIICFSPAKLKAVDNKYRAAAGKPVDEVTAE